MPYFKSGIESRPDYVDIDLIGNVMRKDATGKKINDGTDVMKISLTQIQVISPNYSAITANALRMREIFVIFTAKSIFL